MPRVVHFELLSDDPEQSVKFFSDVFGWLKILVFQTMGMPTQWVRSWSLVRRPMRARARS